MLTEISPAEPGASGTGAFPNHHRTGLAPIGLRSPVPPQSPVLQSKCPQGPLLDVAAPAALIPALAQCSGGHTSLLALSRPRGTSYHLRLSLLRPHLPISTHRPLPRGTQWLQESLPSLLPFRVVSLQGASSAGTLLHNPSRSQWAGGQRAQRAWVNGEQFSREARLAHEVALTGQLEARVTLSKFGPVLAAGLGESLVDPALPLSPAPAWRPRVCLPTCCAPGKVIILNWHGLQC